VPRKKRQRKTATVQKKPTSEELFEESLMAKPDTETKHEKKPEAEKPQPAAGIPGGMPEHPGGKEEVRLFQPAPDRKEWLTKDEAEAAGFFWLVTPGQKT
jgi:hypothetical protein